MDAPVETVIVFTGGEPLAPGTVPALPADAYVIAADSGLDHAHRLGWRADVAVGDFDSVTADALARAEREGTRIERHPVAKDATDLELALDAASALGPRRVLVVGGHGGRLDHLLGNILALATPALSGVEVDAIAGAARLAVVRGRRVLEGRPGELVSLLAVGGPAEGVTTEGLLYALWSETLTPGSSRGTSNQFVRTCAAVTVEAGTLLAIRPGQQGPPVALEPADPEPFEPEEEP